MTLEGGCFCGRIRYRATTAPTRVAHCHCEHCRRTSGAAFLTWMEIPRARFQWLQGTLGHVDSRPGVRRGFCRDCGTPLTWERTDADDPVVDLTACSLDDPSGIEPEDHIWCDRMLPWVRLADGLPRYPRERTSA